ncbi:MAG: hypothetical protein WD249_02165 [Gaiellaceae bacterium]
MARPRRTQFERSLVGPAGEHYVIFRLYQQGMLASLAPGGSPTVDVLVLSPDETVIASLQVKTRTYGRDQGWHMREKHESIVSPRLFYAFVDLEPDVPVTYIVPSSVVADAITHSHREWLATPGRQGQPRRDHAMRRIVPVFNEDLPDYPPGWMEQYREGWHLLKEAVGA